MQQRAAVAEQRLGGNRSMRGGVAEGVGQRLSEGELLKRGSGVTPFEIWPRG